MRLQWTMKFSFLYRLSKNTEQSEYMWWQHMAFFLEIRCKSSKTIRTLFRKSWCLTPCHNLPTRLFYLNICTSSTSVVIFHFLTKVHSFKKKCFHDFRLTQKIGTFTKHCFINEWTLRASNFMKKLALV